MVNIKEDLPQNIRTKLYPFIVNAHEVYKELIRNYPIFKASQFNNNVNPRMVDFLVNAQFDKDIIGDNFPFKVRIIEVNKFKDKRVILEKGNALINIARTNINHCFPYKSKYKLEYAKLNSKYDRQIRFDINPQNELFINSSKYFGFLTYGFNHNEISHTKIIIPDSKIKSIIQEYDLINEYNKLRLINPVNDKKNKKIRIKLKEKVIKEISKKIEDLN